MADSFAWIWNLEKFTARSGFGINHSGTATLLLSKHRMCESSSKSRSRSRNVKNGRLRQLCFNIPPEPITPPPSPIHPRRLYTSAGPVTGGIRGTTTTCWHYYRIASLFRFGPGLLKDRSQNWLRLRWKSTKRIVLLSLVMKSL